MVRLLHLVSKTNFTGIIACSVWKIFTGETIMYRLIVLLVLIQLAGAANYYVDNRVTASGDGSVNAPFKSIGEGMDAVSAGDTLFIRGGSENNPVIYQENLSFSDSGPQGQEGAPIVMTAYPDEYVTIYPSGKVGVYASWWVIENLTFDMQKDTNDLFRVSGTHNTFRNLTVTNGSRDGFDMNNASYTLIENCRIYNFNRNDEYDAHGIILDGGEGIVIRNNRIWDCKGDCIQLYKTEINHNTLIENNELFTTLGPGSENAIDLKGTARCIIRNNIMYGFARTSTSDGVALKISKNSDSLLIENNNIYASNGGIRIAGGQADHFEIYNNVIHDMEESDSPYTDAYGIQLDGVTDLKMYNNTLANMNGPYFWIADGVTDMDMRNNIFHNTGGLKGSVSDFNGSVIIDYNGWYNENEAIGGDHDVTGTDPLFTDPAAGDYTLQAASSAVDAGDPSFGADYPGGRIDLGAFEYEGNVSAAAEYPARTLTTFRLKANYPNPFNPLTRIPFELARREYVRLEVYNIMGQRVAVLINGTLSAGSHAATFDGAHLAGGTYFYRLTAGSVVATRKMLLIK